MKTIKKIADIYDGGNEIATVIDSTCTNDQVAGAKAVYDVAQENYSTTEQKIGTWIDGKPLYEITITTAMPNVTSDGTEVSKLIELPNSDVAVIANCWVKQSGGAETFWPLPYYNNSMRFAKIFTTIVPQYPNSYTIYLTSSGTAYNGSTAYIVVRYTKSTDSAS